jgi:ABC-type transport system involved in Fe-S cluster assembly fused permease/ATPase subunit
MDLATTFLILLVLLQFGDGVTTINILEKGGKELNPVMNFLFDKFGVLPTFVATKILIVWCFWAANIWWATAIMCAVYTWVVWHNLGQLKK